LILWLRRHEQEQDEDAWALNDRDFSFECWKLVDVFGLECLPHLGKLLEQPDWLVKDLFTIAWRKKEVENMLKGRVPAPQED